MSTISTTRILHAPANASTSGRHGSWVWPLPRLDGAAPCILAADDGRETDGIAIGYAGLSLSPSLVPVFAVQDGIITYAGNDADGATLSIDHAGGWSTYYSELECLLARPTDRFQRRRKQRVRAGDVVGYARRSTLRIRFALSRLIDESCVAMDEATSMPAWSMLPWFAEQTPRGVGRAAV